MRAGIDETTGQVLTGWPHCEQSIRRCLRTRFRSIDMRYHIGSETFDLQDQNADPGTIFRVFTAVANALADPDGGEPGYRLMEIEVASAGRQGRFLFLLSGFFFPLGHLGDYSIYEDRSTNWPVNAA